MDRRRTDAPCTLTGIPSSMSRSATRWPASSNCAPPTAPRSRKSSRACRARGVKHIAIISGDHEEPTRRLAEKLGMDRYFAEVLPQDKARYVEQLQTEGRTVCFVGDGINDSIALKKANVSISLRGASSIATDTAQIVFMEESAGENLRPERFLERPRNQRPAEAGISSSFRTASASPASSFSASISGIRSSSITSPRSSPWPMGWSRSSM